MRRLGLRPGVRGLLAVLMAGAMLGMARDAALEKELEAAIHRETIMGDLPGAIERYQAIAAQGKDRETAARALLRMARCQEKLGRRKEARASYQRVAREFNDQARAAAEARSRLSGWMDAAPGPRNLGFEEGVSGQAPPGWFTPAMPRGENAAELRRKGCRSSHGCVVVAGGAQRPNILMQSFSAAAYRGKTMRLRASLRVEAERDEDQGSMWLRVDRGAQSGYADSMDDHPVRTGAWTSGEVVTEVAADAQFLELGVSSLGRGRVWVDDLSFDVVPKAELDSAREAVASQYLAMDAAFEQGGRDADAAVVPGAAFHVYGRQTALREVLQPAGYGSYQTAITGFRLSGTGAIATVRSEFGNALDEQRPPGVATYRDAWVRTYEGWRLKDRVFLAGHYRGRRTDGDTAKLVAADLKQLAAPLAIVEAGHRFDDLAPFGSAVGDARAVVLGAPTDGTREVFRLRHRLLEYLAKEKGFRVLAIAANGLDGEAIDRYVQTGEGDPRSALAGANLAVQEVMDAIEWMRAYNRSHAKLSFVALGHCEAITTATVTDPHECADDRLVRGIEAALAGSAGRIAVWANNFDVAPLRARLGQRVYVTGFALAHGEVRAVAVVNGQPAASLARLAIPRSADGTGDWVFGSAGMPLFFLDLRSVPRLTTLGLWLAEPHLLLTARGEWNRDDAASHLHPVVMEKLYDGLIFIAEGHAAQELEAAPAVTH